MIIDLDFLKTQLGIDLADDSRDENLQHFLDIATSIVECEVKRPLFQATRTEYYDGNGQRELCLLRRPVTEIVSVHEDCRGFFGSYPDSFDPNTELVSGEDYALKLDAIFGDQGTSESGILIRIDSVWPRVRLNRRENLNLQVAHSLGSIRVQYEAGYSADNMPANLKYAVAALVGLVQSTAAQGFSLQSESLDYYSYTRGSGEDELKRIEDVRSILRKFRSPVF